MDRDTSNFFTKTKEDRRMQVPSPSSSSSSSFFAFLSSGCHLRVRIVFFFVLFSHFDSYSCKTEAKLLVPAPSCFTRVPSLWKAQNLNNAELSNKHAFSLFYHLKIPRGGSSSTGTSSQSTTGMKTRIQPKNCFHASTNNIQSTGSNCNLKNNKIKDDINKNSKPKAKMYLTCAAIVLLWISTGTIFYSKYNEWPLPQSFFYAVDAGMSIGFCTDVVETKIGSRAFTIIFILLGASSVGGALALFIQDIMEGAIDFRNGRFEAILANHTFCRSDADSDGKVNYQEFRDLIQKWIGCEQISNEHFYKICRKYDPSQKGYVANKTFMKHIPDVNLLLYMNSPLYSDKWYIRKVAEAWNVVKILFNGQNRIFSVCLAWVITGVLWGKMRMHWDLITATHFAVSALATGGLTGPPVNKDGILPLEPAIFCGVYCLIGIPLFALTLGHFARILVESHIIADEKHAIDRPIQKCEFDFAKRLCTPNDQMVHLSDFIVLQLLRMGKVNMRTIDLIKTQFEILDTSKSGQLPLEEATCMESNKQSTQ
mmetsp:Transcript_3379/g.3940  ORF Transcript_3379/g.3940 Transcript_3379/m.3940 type:complete len:539 (+) Transcript_3379:111-1727(+)